MPGRLLIRNGVLALPGGPLRADVLCEGAKITVLGRDIPAPGAAEFDAAGLTLGPGFVDIHVHGGGGYTFFSRSTDNLAGYSSWAPAHGVTSYLVSTLGRDEGETERILFALSSGIGHGEGAEPLGFHLEGPFLNPIRKGAFEASMLRAPSRGEFARYQEAAHGHIRQVTVGPELPLALDAIAAIGVSGAVPAMGHTDASSVQARAGFESGIRHVTHLFNAMRPFHHREGGPIAAALLDDSVTCELICDGFHVGPDALRLAYRVLGPSRTVVVTDNLAAAGTGTIEGELAGQALDLSGAAAVRADGVIAGSLATMDQQFRNVIGYLGTDLATAFRLCSTNPARVAGAGDRKGAIHRGMDADITMLDSSLGVVATLCRGDLYYCTEPARFRASPAPGRRRG